jgi:hypothetical protein
MIRTLLIISLFIGSFTAKAQNAELDSRNGFKNIKLLSMATEYNELKFEKQQEEDSKAIYVRKSGALQTIGEIQIKELNVYTYNDIIYRIEVSTGKNTQLFKGLEKAYGKSKFAVVSNVYVWQGENVKLTFASQKGGKRIVMNYTTPKIKEIIKQDEMQKLKDLSDDF